MMKRHSIGIIVLTTVVALGIYAPFVSAHGGDPDLIHACVQASGIIKIIAPDENCPPSNVPLDWNIVGPQGPQGDPGENTIAFAVGDGSTFTTIPPGPDVWSEMMSVTVTPKVDGQCVVTASFTARLGDNLIQTTLHTAADARGPWVQVHSSGTLPGWESSAMTQAFDVVGEIPATFYMNGENRGTNDVTTENTRIWVLCGEGDVEDTLSFPAFAVPQGPGNE